MNHSKIIRNELRKFQTNEIILASKFYKEILHNQNVSETSFYKLLERMYKSEQLVKLSKGIYYIPNKTKFGIVPISDEKIISLFINDNQGMVVGYSLYNKLNLTTQISKKITILSSNVSNEIKNIRNIEIKNVKMNYSKDYIKIIEMLEVLQNFNDIQDINYNAFYKYVKEFSEEFNETNTDYVIENINYKKSTISFLHNILNYFGVNNNLNKHLSSLSKYKHFVMEDIDEFTQTRKRF